MQLDEYKAEIGDGSIEICPVDDDGSHFCNTDATIAMVDEDECIGSIRATFGEIERLAQVLLRWVADTREMKERDRLENSSIGELIGPEELRVARESVIQDRLADFRKDLEAKSDFELLGKDLLDMRDDAINAKLRELGYEENF